MTKCVLYIISDMGTRRLGSVGGVELLTGSNTRSPRARVVIGCSANEGARICWRGDRKRQSWSGALAPGLA